MQSRCVTPNEAGQRLDKLLVKVLNKAPKSFIYKMLRKKNITLNDKKADGSEKLAVGDTIKLWLSEDTIAKFSEENAALDAVMAVKDALDIIYEDKNILVINKPSGVLSQKAAPEDVSVNEEVISYMLRTGQLRREELGSFRPAVCHRLDRNTSGLLVAGKSLAGLQDMAQLIRSRELGKYYCCLVHGVVKEKTVIRGYLTKDDLHNRVYISQEKTAGGDFIETRYEPVATNGKQTLLWVHLITGRSHQIRAHLASIGHAIAGDSKYGDKPDNKYLFEKYHLKYQLLHCVQLVMPKDTLRLDGLSGKVFRAPLPSLFTCILREEKITDKVDDHGNLEFKRA